MKIQHINFFLLFFFINSIKINAMNEQSHNLESHQTMLHCMMTSLTSKEEKIYRSIISEQKYVNNQFHYSFLLQQGIPSPQFFISTKQQICSPYRDRRSVCSEKSLPTKHSLLPSDY